MLIYATSYALKFSSFRVSGPEFTHYGSHKNSEEESLVHIIQYFLATTEQVSWGKKNGNDNHALRLINTSFLHTNE